MFDGEYVSIFENMCAHKWIIEQESISAGLLAYAYAKKKKNPQYFELLCTVIRTQLSDDSLIVARARTVQVVIDLELFFTVDFWTICQHNALKL